MSRAKILITFVTMFFFILISINASAIPTDSNGDVLDNNGTGYSWIDAPYWTGTDLSSNDDGTSSFQLTARRASYDNAFGLFTPDSFDNPTAVNQTHIVHDFATSEQGATQATTVDFKKVGSDWFIKNDDEADNAYDPFNNKFGFFYKVDKNNDYEKDKTDEMDNYEQKDRNFSGDTIDKVKNRVIEISSENRNSGRKMFRKFVNFVVRLFRFD